MTMENQLIVSAAPHLKDTTSIPRIMWSVVISLVPALAGAVYFFGWPALTVTCLSVASAVLAEAVMQKLQAKEFTINDGSAVVTGMLLAFNLPPLVPFWMPVLGAAFAMVVGKHVFGGLGHNPLNPALLGRAFLAISWPAQMAAGWAVPRGGTLPGTETMGSVPPLAVWQSAFKSLAIPSMVTDQLVAAEQALSQLSDVRTYADLFIGRVGGCLGETSVLLLLAGALFLLYKKYIEWRLPLTYISTVGVLAWAWGGPSGAWFKGDPLFHVLAGGLFLGAFFMATDPVTSPLTNKGKVVFGLGCGILTMFIRLKGNYMDSICFAVLFMNLLAPIIDRYTKPGKFGKVRT
jgi:Na+-translocating ferredoxin:NAD+ oxidoreductase subunit D